MAEPEGKATEVVVTIGGWETYEQGEEVVQFESWAEVVDTTSSNLQTAPPSE